MVAPKNSQKEFRIVAKANIYETEELSIRLQMHLRIENIFEESLRSSGVKVIRSTSSSLWSLVDYDLRSWEAGHERSATHLILDGTLEWKKVEITLQMPVKSISQTKT